MTKRVLVTGGNKGIGHHITQLFLEQGDQVVVVARDFQKFDLADHEGVTVIPYDLSNVRGIGSLVGQVGDIDILINNAGISTGLTAPEYTPEDADYIVNVNLGAPIALITAYLPQLQKKRGRVVNVASQAGVLGHFDPWYAATKAGLINVTQSFAALYGREGLVINSVAPGPVDVDAITKTPRPERFERLKQRTILKRFARPQEVAQVVYWLAKESPEYLNGQNYLINNGVPLLDA
jgi:3-oxoacyl-[acyl-carrier protein] reductase